MTEREEPLKDHENEAKQEGILRKSLDGGRAFIKKSMEQLKDTDGMLKKRMSSVFAKKEVEGSETTADENSESKGGQLFRRLSTKVSRVFQPTTEVGVDGEEKPSLTRKLSKKFSSLMKRKDETVETPTEIVEVKPSLGDKLKGFAGKIKASFKKDEKKDEKKEESA